MEFNEYLAFMLLYAASVDLILELEEKELILKIVEQSEYKDIKKSFDKINDYERIQLIKKYKEQFITSEDIKRNVLLKIKDVFLADDQYLAIEKAIFLYLGRLLEVK